MVLCRWSVCDHLMPVRLRREIMNQLLDKIDQLIQDLGCNIFVKHANISKKAYEIGCMLQVVRI